MERVTVSKKYQIVIPEKLRKSAGIKPGDKMVAIAKHGIIQYIPVRPIKDTEGLSLDLTPKTFEMSLTELISIDSSGWIEWFRKGPKAPKYKQVIESTKPKEIITSVVVLYEVYKKIKKLKGDEEALLAVAALSQTMVVPIDQTVSLEAADYILEYYLHF
jgi:AbrB family looped-hinge helix DNA binding protein